MGKGKTGREGGIESDWLPECGCQKGTITTWTSCTCTNTTTWNSDLRVQTNDCICDSFGRSVEHWLFIFADFNLFILWKKQMLPMRFSCTGPFQPTAPCSQALCTLPSLENLSSLLMRLIKPVQSLFNEASVAWSTERTVTVEKHAPYPKRPQLERNFFFF